MLLYLVINFGKVGYIGAQMVRVLSPYYYHHRLPFFGIVESKDKVTLPHYTQEIFDEEMRYAIEAGIDYFMYCWYEDGSGMDMARTFHETSPHRTQVKMSAMWHITNLMKYSSQEKIAQTLDHLKSDYWQMVGDNRPLIYISSGNEQTLSHINLFRKACKDAGIKNPYLVGIEQFGSTPANVVQFGLDAYSDYAIGGSNGLPFSSLADKAINQWNMDIRSVSQYIPLVPAGWDPRPRIQSPVTWETPGRSMMAYIQPAAPVEIAALLQKALDFNAQNPGKTNINSVLIYAWNEHDEGGWLCPTIIDYKLDGMPVKRSDQSNARDTRRLQSIQKVLQPGATWNLDRDDQTLIPRTSVDGYLTDSDGKPVAGRNVELFTDPISRTVTDAKGYFRFTQIHAGEQTIAVKGQDGSSYAGIFRILASKDGKTSLEMTSYSTYVMLEQPSNNPMTPAPSVTPGTGSGTSGAASIAPDTSSGLPSDSSPSGNGAPSYSADPSDDVSSPDSGEASQDPSADSHNGSDPRSDVKDDAVQGSARPLLVVVIIVIVLSGGAAAAYLLRKHFRLRTDKK